MSPELLEASQIGTHDLRAKVTEGSGFNHILLYDADDGDVIIVNEDDIKPLRDWLNRVLKETNVEE